MARQSAPASKKKNAKGRASQPATRKPAGGNRHAPVEPDSRVLDDRARRDITGVVFIILAVVLMLVAVLPSGEEALVTGVASTWLHLIFGVGCYVLPFVLAAIGVTFLVRFERERVPARAAIGLAIIYIALLGLIAVFTPVTGVNGTNLDLLFAERALSAHGGYVGAGIAWVGLSLFGKIISCVILAGIMIIGIIVIGFSLSSLIEKIRAKQAEHAAAVAEREAALDAQAAPPYARMRRRRNPGTPDAAAAPVAPAGETATIADSAALTRKLIPQDEDRTGKRHRSARNITAPASGAPTQVIAAEDGTAEPAALTRKLGSKKTRKRVDTPEINAAARPQRTSNVTPAAAPHPQEGFVLPPMSLLAQGDGKHSGASEEELAETAARLQETLEDFSIMAQVVGWVAGPTVTLFKVDLPAGVRVSRITALNDDIALALAAPGVRIFAPIPGTNYVGIEVPNRTRQTVLLSDVLESAGPGPLQIAIGKDVEGHAIVSDLAKMPHLLIGGTTGSGKSVSINAMIMSILMRATPAEVRFIMIDPKRVEFTPYNGIPHLYVPVVTEAREAASALSWGVAEMERRLKVFSKVGARNIGQYNAKVQAEKVAAEEAARRGEEPPASELGDELPYIVIIIDELADLMMNVGKEVEFSISRIAQLARAAGIHLIVATQRPSTNVVTGLIKANITNRIAFNVASGIDSRVILDTPGAENLIGLGDLLLSKPEYAKPQRIQGCYVSEDEINAVVSMLKEQGEPEYHSEILSTNIVTLGSQSPDGDGGSSSDDPLVWEAADIVVSSGLGSTSNIQRRLKVGYARAGRIMDQLENKGVVGPANGSKPREVLVDAMELETLKAFELNDAAGASSHMED